MFMTVFKAFFLRTFARIGRAWSWLTVSPVVPVASAYVLAVGVADAAIEHALFRKALTLFSILTPVFKSDAARVYTEFVIYLVIWLAVIGAICLRILCDGSPRFWLWISALCERHWGKLLGAALLFILLATPPFARGCAIFAAIPLSLRLIGNVAQRQLTPDRGMRPRIIVATLLSTLLVTAAMGAMLSAWFPIRLANDYREAIDRIKLPSASLGQPISLLRDEAIDCVVEAEARFETERTGEFIWMSEREQRIIAALAGSLHQSVEDVRKQFVASHSPTSQGPKCRVPFELTLAQALGPALTASGTWQSNAGRTLYHHAFLLVPAQHLLKYGLDAPIPYLYGLGNTAFHTLLIAADPTITRYLATFPIAQLLGLMLIVGAVCYAARSLLIAPLAMATAIIPLCLIGFEIVQLAAGFSPLRYGGLAIQIASLFLLARARPAFGVFALFAALAVSLVWNKEYGIIGCVGQVLALLSMWRSWSMPSRLTLSVVAAATAIALYVGLGIFSRGYVETIQVGIFGIATPMIDPATFLSLATSVAIGCGLLFWMANRHSGREGIARQCLIPVLGLLLMKYVYYAAPVHLRFTLVLLAPMLLVFADWQLRLLLPVWLPLDQGHRQKWTAYLLIAVTLVAAVTAMRYANVAGARQRILIEPFELARWSSLGETFETTTPADAIQGRVAALRNELQDDETVLILSPFDHLLAIYANPRRYCGHFETVTNLVTYDMMARVVACVRETPNALVVYDAAVDSVCPTQWRKRFGSDSLCQSKRMALLNLKSVMTTLLPHLQFIKTVGELSFYRSKTTPTQPPLKSQP